MKREQEQTKLINDQSQWVDLVKKHVASLRFGVVQIVVHDSRVVQIERTEKVRLDQQKEGASL